MIVEWIGGKIARRLERRWRHREKPNASAAGEIYVSNLNEALGLLGAGLLFVLAAIAGAAAWLLLEDAPARVDAPTSWKDHPAVGIVSVCGITLFAAVLLFKALRTPTSIVLHRDHMTVNRFIGGNIYPREQIAQAEVYPWADSQARQEKSDITLLLKTDDGFTFRKTIGPARAALIIDLFTAN